MKAQIKRETSAATATMTNPAATTTTTATNGGLSVSSSSIMDKNYDLQQESSKNEGVFIQGSLTHSNNTGHNYCNSTNQRSVKQVKHEDTEAVIQYGPQLVAQNKRKEKARIAARARRSQEASIIMDIANELHITQEKIRRIDKATIVKLAIDYIKAFEILCRFRSNCASNNFSTNVNQNGDKINININNDNTNYNYTNDNSCSMRRRSNSISISCISQISNSSNSENSCISKRNNYDLIDDTNNDTSANNVQPMPKLSTGSIFAPKTDDMDSYFLMINDSDGRPSFILKPDNEILDEDDLTHLAPQAGDSSISLDVEPLDGIVLDTSLFNSGSPPMKKAPLGPPSHPLMMATSGNRTKGLIDNYCIIGTVD